MFRSTHPHLRVNGKWSRFTTLKGEKIIKDKRSVHIKGRNRERRIGQKVKLSSQMVNNALIYLFIIIANTYNAIFKVGSIYKVGSIIPILLMKRGQRG